MTPLLLPDLTRASASAGALFVVAFGMDDSFEVGVQGDLIIVREPATAFYAIYSKSTDPPQLILQRRRPIKDRALIARARQAAVDKARELEWIV